MKKYKLIIIKVICLVVLIASLLLLLLSPVKLRVNDTHVMAKAVISKEINDSNNPDLKVTAKMVKNSGLEDALINTLPRKFKLDFSYARLYKLSRKYNQNGKLTKGDLGLKTTNRVAEVINNFLIKEINYELKQKSAQLAHVITIYQISIFVIILLYLLAAVLIIFNRYWAVLPILIGSLSSFGALWYFCKDTNYALQHRVYTGINLNVAPGIYFGLILALLVSVAWPFLLRVSRRGEEK